MKKVIALVLACLMAVAMFAGCGGGGEGGGSASGNKDVAVFYYTYGDAYISTVRTALDKILTDAGISFDDYDSNSNQTTQTEQVQTAITKGAKLLIVNIVTSSSDDAANEIISQAKAADIPVIFFNREVSDDAVNSYEKCAFVGTNAPEAGHLQGEMIGKFLVENYEATDLNGDGVITYEMFKGQEGNAEAEARTQYGVEDANAVLEAAGKPALEYFDASNSNKYHVDLDNNWSAKAATEYMDTNLGSYSEASNNMIELVICNNDSMAEGAISSLNTKGYNLGTESETPSITIPVFGVDATDAAKKLIADGKMTGTIKQDADSMAACIGTIAANGLAGDDLMKGLDDYNIDTDSDKVRIAYQIYTGE